MKNPLISIVIAVYNGESFLAAALDSLCAQCDDEIEVIVVDGQSTDGTAQILASYSDKLNMKIVEFERVGTWVSKANRGLSIARGDYACFLSNDDLWLEDRLRILRPILCEEPPPTLVLNSSWFIDSQGDRKGLWSCPLPGDGGRLSSELVVERLLVQNFIASHAPLFLREAALRVGGLDENLWYTSDWDLWLKLAAEGDTVYVPRPLTAFRIHPHSVTMTESGQTENFRNQIETVLDRHLPIHEMSFPKKLSVRQAARFSVDVNTALAGYIHGRKFVPWELLRKFFAMRPNAWLRYLRDSRIMQRVIARLQVGLANPQSSGG
jgi:glycosyltransferase involved in cell wall biosynthesis